MRVAIIFLSCEHGGNSIPVELNDYFIGKEELLNSHRGRDLGALQLFNLFSSSVNPMFAISCEVCRLVVDLNRSLHRRTLFSEITKPLPLEQKQIILNNYYFPFRNAFKNAVQESLESNNSVLHLSVHSFTPVLNGIERQTDIGILYHPAREWESSFASKWKIALANHLPHLRVRFNYPYLGKPDGHVAFHRKMYDNSIYAGIELEVNSKYAFNDEINRGIVNSFMEVMNTQNIKRG